MASLILREVARWGRAVVAPLAVLTVVTACHTVAPSGVVPTGAHHALTTAWRAALITCLAWLATSVIRATLQPVRDRRAFELLQDLRVRSRLPDHALLCILRRVWSTAAGERADAVDVRTGLLVDLWLTETTLPSGSYALVRNAGGSCLLVDAAPPRLVIAAQRHARAGHAPRRDSGRPQCRAAAQVVRAAERLLR